MTDIVCGHAFACFNDRQDVCVCVGGGGGVRGGGGMHVLMTGRMYVCVCGGVRGGGGMHVLMTGRMYVCVCVGGGGAGWGGECMF